jgi:hypothetical protein
MAAKCPHPQFSLVFSLEEAADQGNCPTFYRKRRIISGAFHFVSVRTRTASSFDSGVLEVSSTNHSNPERCRGIIVLGAPLRAPKKENP